MGQLQVDRWTDRESGEIRNRAKVVVRDIDVLETRAEAELRRGGSQQQRGGQHTSSFGDDDMDYNGPTKAGSGGFFDN